MYHDVCCEEGGLWRLSPHPSNDCATTGVVGPCSVPECQTGAEFRLEVVDVKDWESESAADLCPEHFQQHAAGRQLRVRLEFEG
jgi:hypothetical protein